MATHYRDWQEGRRFRAFELSQQGWGVSAIARALGVSKGAVSQWLTRAREHGQEALRTRPHPGKVPRLSAEDEQRLPELLARGPEAHGFRGDVWTRRRVALIIQRAFGVRYSVWQVGRILRRVGYSPQKPVLRATQRKEADVERWRAERLPAIQKKRG